MHEGSLEYFTGINVTETLGKANGTLRLFLIYLPLVILFPF